MPAAAAVVVVALIAGVGVFGLSRSVQAAEPAGPAQLDLATALELAEEHNPQGALSDADLTLARVGRDRAWSLIQPNVSLGANYRVNDREVSLDFAESFGGSGLTSGVTSIYDNLGLIYGELYELGSIDADDCQAIAEANGLSSCDELDQFLDPAPVETPPAENLPPTVIQPKDQWNVSAQVNWPLNPRVVPLVAAGEEQVRAARARGLGDRNRLASSVVRSYAGAYLALAALPVLERQVELVTAHRARVELMQSVGMATADQISRAGLELVRAKRSLREGVVQAAQARRALGGLLGGMDLADSTLSAPVVAAPLVLGSDVSDDAVRSHPAMEAARAGESALRHLAVSGGMAFLPTVSVQGAWNWSDQAAGFDARKSSWYVGVGFNLPVWDGGTRVHDAREGVARGRQARAQRSSSKSKRGPRRRLPGIATASQSFGSPRPRPRSCLPRRPSGTCSSGSTRARGLSWRCWRRSRRSKRQAWRRSARTSTWSSPRQTSRSPSAGRRVRLRGGGVPSYEASSGGQREGVLMTGPGCSDCACPSRSPPRSGVASTLGGDRNIKSELRHDRVVLVRPGAGHVRCQREGFGDDVGSQIEVIEFEVDDGLTLREGVLPRDPLSGETGPFDEQFQTFDEGHVSALRGRGLQLEHRQPHLVDVTRLHTLILNLLGGRDVHRDEVGQPEVAHQLLEQRSAFHGRFCFSGDLEMEQRRGACNAGEKQHQHPSSTRPGSSPHRRLASHPRSPMPRRVLSRVESTAANSQPFPEDATAAGGWAPRSRQYEGPSLGSTPSSYPCFSPSMRSVWNGPTLSSATGMGATQLVSRVRYELARRRIRVWSAPSRGAPQALDPARR